MYSNLYYQQYRVSQVFSVERYKLADSVGKNEKKVYTYRFRNVPLKVSNKNVE